MTYRQSKLEIPYNWETADMKGFIEYAKTYYRKIWSIAFEDKETCVSYSSKLWLRRLSIFAVDECSALQEWRV